MNQKRNKKMGRKLTAWVTLVAMVLTIFSPVGSSKVAKAALTPLQYYQEVESINRNKTIDYITQAYSSYFKNYQEALNQKVAAEVTINATLDPSIAEKIGADDLKSVKTSIKTTVKGSKTKAIMDFYANDKQITSLEAYEDVTDLNGLFYLLIPDLSSSFLKCSMKDSYDSDATYTKMQEEARNYLNDPISADVLNQVLKKYSALAMNGITDVTMKENDIVSVEEVKQEYTKLTVQMNERTALNIANVILETAKSDTSLRDIFVDSGIYTKEEYDKEIKAALKDKANRLKALKESNGSTIFTMSIWVDKDDSIVGRSIVLNDSEDYFKFGYKTAKEGTSMGIDVWAGGKEDVVQAKGSFSANLIGATGNVKIYVPDSSKKTPDVIRIDFEDLKYKTFGKKSYINGEINITSDLLDGKSIKINCNGDLSKQDIIFDVLQGTKSLVNVSMTARETSYQDFDLPTSDVKTYDMTTQFDEYLQDSDLKGFLQKIKDKTDVKVIDDYMDELLLSYEE